MNFAPFGKNLESAIKASYYRDYVKLTQEAEKAAEVACQFPVGSEDWRAAAAQFAALENKLTDIRDLHARIEGRPWPI